MLHHNEPTQRKARIRHVPEWRMERAPYEAAYLMKLGGLDHADALALIAKHRGDNFNIMADLFSRRSR
jgi:hypothetical protein